ncbi:MULTISPECIES: ComF family protein [Kocuria]|uniref:ComF family protein n=1 Tax=Kocuria subflava TaxID=1736139 RepID=A0A846TTX7_9MICC|nr:MULTISPECIES: phosphoribosyltransferase family protein [Kocuria]NKE10460.1 ComF family protein [Kocuria subflava]
MDRAAATVLSAMGEALEVVIPVECAVCRAPAATLCAPCRRLLSRTTVHPRRVEHHARHTQGLPIVAAGRYEHELATCLLAFKQAGRTDLTTTLSSVLARALRAAIGSDPSGGAFQPVELVPVPSSATALRRRWFDPVKVLLGAVDVEATVNPDVHCVPWLAHTSCDPGGSLRSLAGRVRTAGGGQAQKFKTADQRAVTGKPPFRVVQGRGDRSAGRRRPTRVILVDDVVTTGATLNRARRTLEEAGATVLGAVVLAAANTPTLEVTGAASQKSV